MPRKKINQIWIGLIAALLILFYSGKTITDQELQHNLHVSSEAAKEELLFLADLVQQQLQKHDYQLAKKLVTNWGERKPDTVEIILTTKNNFEVARYYQDLNPIHRLIEEVELIYSYNGKAILRLNKSIDEIHAAHENIVYKILAIYSFIVISFFYITFLLVKSFNQKQEICLENKWRIHTEKKLLHAEKIARLGSWELDFTDNKLHWSNGIGLIYEVNADNFSTTHEAFLGVVHPDDHDMVSQHYHDYDETKKNYRSEHRLLMKDGQIKFVNERCETQFDKYNKPLRSIGTIVDVTEHKKTEHALQRSQKMDALGQLTGGVAHDYNNMLGVIMGYAGILDKKLKHEPDLAQYANKIYSASERGAKLTKKLLSFSKHKIINAKLININELLYEEKDMLEKVLTARIRLIYDFDENLWQTTLDEGDLEDVILNMCINAMHAIKINGRVTISTKNEQIYLSEDHQLQLEKGDYIRLSISDTGCGMDEKTKEKIFEPFYSTKGENGTGLGLAQVYGFVERSKGKIQVRSEPGKGTEFVLYFPRSDDAALHEFTRKEKNSVSPNIRANGSETILIVDDEPALLEITSELLEQQGYRTICVNNAKEALKQLENEKIDLFLSDIIMPEMNGYELAKIVRKNYPHIKIQLVSGFSKEENLETIDLHFQKTLLHKPYNINLLYDRINELLH